MNRRTFCRRVAGGVLGGLVVGCSRRGPEMVEVNDVHSRLTATEVRRVLTPRSHDELVRVLRRALHHNAGLSVAGGRHSMGRQAFGTGTIHFDLTGLTEVGDLDGKAGLVRVAPGCMWPRLMEELDRRQQGEERPWSIRQKQTGADDLTLGGAMACNMHGRGLGSGPFVGDIEAFDLFTAEGEELECSRERNADWFRLVLGGYGLFGVVTGLTLRLRRRARLRRRVELIELEEVPLRVAQREAEGAQYGDFQFSVASESEGFLRDGILSTYGPTDEEESVGSGYRLSRALWTELMVLAHTDPAEAFRRYVEAYRKTDGQIYASDRQQLSTYLPDYHEVVMGALGAEPRRSLLITEVYVPRERLVGLMEKVREVCRDRQVRLVYGVVRWIERDGETFLPWARDRFACVVFNVSVEHSEAGQARVQGDVRELVEAALAEGGSFYLTYGNAARGDQVMRAYPEFGAFLAEKEKRDRHLVWRSDWFTQYARKIG
ncbi:MAG: FAD-binding protein [Verrucomicrobiia bacterium]